MRRLRRNATRNAAIAAVLAAGMEPTDAAALRGTNVHRDPGSGRLVILFRRGPGRVETIVLTVDQHVALLAHVEATRVHQVDAPLFAGCRGPLTRKGISTCARRHRRFEGRAACAP